MPSFEITVDQKTYHVDIPWLHVGTLPLIVDGKPFELRISGAGDGESAEQWASEVHAAILEQASKKPCMAEWQASRRAE